MTAPIVLNKKALCGLTGIYVGRPSKWGNPFVIGRDGDRDEVIRKFEKRLCDDPDMMEEAITELRGHNLICFCFPRACHADVLLRYANAPGGEEDEACS